jgi:hypothetical protein
LTIFNFTGDFLLDLFPCHFDYISLLFVANIHILRFSFELSESLMNPTRHYLDFTGWRKSSQPTGINHGLSRFLLQAAQAVQPQAAFGDSASGLRVTIFYPVTL